MRLLGPFFSQEAILDESLDRRALSEHCNQFALGAVQQMEDLHDRWVDERDARIDLEVASRMPPRRSSAKGALHVRPIS